MHFLVFIQPKKRTLYKTTILRLEPGDERIKQLPDWSDKFNGSVGTGQSEIENGLAVPKGGVIVLSKKNTKTSGSPVHFLLSTGQQVVATKTREVTSAVDFEIPPAGQPRRKKSAWQSLQAKFGGLIAFNKGKSKAKKFVNSKFQEI